MIKSIGHSFKDSQVAQSVEQVAVNHPVGGSNPSLGAFSTQPVSTEL